MKLLLTIARQWRTLLAALLLAGVVHIATVLALPSFYRSDAYARLARSLPANSFVTLPVAQPKAQVLPFQTPDTRYAVCRFDATAGPVAVRATLPEAGWSLSLYTANGEGFYTFPAADQRPVTLSLVVVPPGEKFLGSSSDARGQDPRRNAARLAQRARPRRVACAAVRPQLCRRRRATPDDKRRAGS